MSSTESGPIITMKNITKKLRWLELCFPPQDAMFFLGHFCHLHEDGIPSWYLSCIPLCAIVLNSKL